MSMTHPEQVSQALGIPFSDQQLAAICAPLEPGVVIAGAGSGKTAVMAARVVWLVGTGQVDAEQCWPHAHRQGRCRTRSTHP